MRRRGYFYTERPPIRLNLERVLPLFHPDVAGVKENLSYFLEVRGKVLEVTAKQSKETPLVVSFSHFLLCEDNLAWGRELEARICLANAVVYGRGYWTLTDRFIPCFWLYTESTCRRRGSSLTLSFCFVFLRFRRIGKNQSTGIPW